MKIKKKKKTKKKKGKQTKNKIEMITHNTINPYQTRYGV
jgi:hypothetical protein